MPDLAVLPEQSRDASIGTDQKLPLVFYFWSEASAGWIEATATGSVMSAAAAKTRL
jgi:hypothetical protein